MRTVKRACHLCEAMCGLEIDVDGDRVVAVRGNDDDVFSRGYLCPKGAAIGDLHHDPDRLRTPVRRVGSGPDATWEPIGWDEALDFAADGLNRIREEHGDSAVGAYLGNPTVHSHGSLFLPLLLKALRSKNIFSASTVDQRPQEFAYQTLFGAALLVPVPDVDRTAFLLVMGANPAVSNGSLMTAPDLKRRIKDVRARGGRVVVIDPRRTETARIADTHHFIRPGTDALLLLAMLNTIAAERLSAPGRLAGFTDGIDEVLAAAAPFTPEAVAPVTGIDADAIRALARDFAAAESAAAYGRVGTCHQEHGTTTSWLVQVLNIVTGNLDRPGGVMFTTPALDVVAASGPTRRGRWESRVRGLPEFMGEIPVATMSDEILTEGEGRVRAMLVSAGNPVLSTPDGRRVDEAFAALDFFVAIDLYVTETSRHADIILPPVSPLERSHYDHAFSALAIHNIARWSPPVFDAPADGMQDFEVFVELAARVAGSTRAEIIASRFGPDVETPDDVVAMGFAFGPYGADRGDGRPLTFDDVRDTPDGIDLGPLQPRLPERLLTSDQRIQLAAPELLAEVELLVGRLAEAPDAADDGLLLIGRRQLRSNNSWMHNQERLVKGRDRCTLLVHPDDATRHELSEGDRVVVTSRVSSLEVPIEISDEVMVGVVSIPHGWGHGRTGVGWKTAAANPGVSVNDLTDATLLDRLSGNAALSEVPVTLARA